MAVKDIGHIQQQIISLVHDHDIGVFLAHRAKLIVGMEKGVSLIIMLIVIQDQALGFAVARLNSPEAVITSAVAQLTVGVAAPVPHIAVGTYRCHMLASHGDRNGTGKILVFLVRVSAVTLSNLHSMTHKSGAWPLKIVFVALIQAQLALHVGAPGIHDASCFAQHRAVADDGFAGLAAGCHSQHVLQFPGRGPHPDRPGLLPLDNGVAHQIVGVYTLNTGLTTHTRNFLHQIFDVIGRLFHNRIADLTIGVLAKRSHRAIGQQCQRVVAASGHAHHVDQIAAHLTRNLVSRIAIHCAQLHPHRHAISKGRTQSGIIAAHQCAVKTHAQLAIGIIAPTEERAVTAQGQHMAATGGNGHDLTQVVALARSLALHDLNRLPCKLIKGGLALHDLVTGLVINGRAILAARGHKLPVLFPFQILLQCDLVILIAPLYTAVCGPRQHPICAVGRLTVLLVTQGHKVIICLAVGGVVHGNGLIGGLQIADRRIIKLQGENKLIHGGHLVAAVVAQGPDQFAVLTFVFIVVTQIRQIAQGFLLQLYKLYQIIKILSIEIITVQIIGIGLNPLIVASVHHLTGKAATHTAQAKLGTQFIVDAGIGGVIAGAVGQLTQVLFAHLVVAEHIIHITHAQLALVVAAPAPDRVTLGAHNGKAIPGSDLHDLAKHAADIRLHCGEAAVTNHVARIIGAHIIGRIKGKLTKRVVAPNVHSSLPGQSGGVTPTGGHRHHMTDHRSKTALRIRDRTHSHRRVGEGLFLVVDAQLAVGVVTPSPYRSVRFQRNGKVLAQSDHRRGLIGIFPLHIFADSILYVEDMHHDHGGAMCFLIINPHGGLAVLLACNERITLYIHHVGVGGSDFKLCVNPEVLVNRDRVALFIFLYAHLLIALRIFFGDIAARLILPHYDLFRRQIDIGLDLAVRISGDVTVVLLPTLGIGQTVIGNITLARPHDIYRIAGDQLQIVAQRQIRQLHFFTRPVGKLTIGHNDLRIQHTALGESRAAAGRFHQLHPSLSMGPLHSVHNIIAGQQSIVRHRQLIVQRAEGSVTIASAAGDHTLAGTDHTDGNSLGGSKIPGLIVGVVNVLVDGVVCTEGQGLSQRDAAHVKLHLVIGILKGLQNTHDKLVGMAANDLHGNGVIHRDDQLPRNISGRALLRRHINGPKHSDVIGGSLLVRHSHDKAITGLTAIDISLGIIDSAIEAADDLDMALRQGTGHRRAVIIGSHEGILDLPHRHG